MNAPINSFMRDLGTNPKALSAYKANPSGFLSRSGLEPEHVAAIASKDPAAINRAAARSLGIEADVGDDINVIVVVTV
jgi:hypothetical protein